MEKKEIFEIIVSHICEIIPELENHSFEPGDSLKSLGANSIDRAEILTMTLESLSLHIPLVELASASNIGELVETIHEVC